MSITMEQLEACIGLAQRTRGMRERIEHIKAMAELSGIKSESIGGNGRPLDDGTGEGGSMLADLLDAFQEEVKKYYEIAWAVERAVKNAQMNEYQRDVIRYRYEDGMTWEEVARAMNYGIRQCHNLKNEAFQAFGLIPNEED